MSENLHEALRQIQRAAARLSEAAESLADARRYRMSPAHVAARGRLYLLACEALARLTPLDGAYRAPCLMCEATTERQTADLCAACLARYQALGATQAAQASAEDARWYIRADEALHGATQ